MKNVLTYQIYIDLASIQKSINECCESNLPLIPIGFFENIESKIVEEMQESSLSNFSLVPRGCFMYVPEIGYEYKTMEDTDDNVIQNIKQMRNHYRAAEEIEGLYLENVHMKVYKDQTSIKGMQSKLVTQAMDHAMHDNYDILFLVADDNEFVPLIKELRTAENLKYTYHVGFKSDQLRSAAFGSIDLSEKVEALGLPQV